MVKDELTTAGIAVPAKPMSARRMILLRRKMQTENRLAAMDARERKDERKRDTRRKIIVGAAVLAHAKIDPSFAAKLQEVLSLAVTRPGDRKAIADQLGN
jgi:hypothetical protein